MNAIIRSAQASDHPQVLSLFSELDRLHRENAPWLLHEPVLEPRPLKWLEQQLANPRSAVFLASADRCVGLATVHLRDAPAFPVFIPQRHAVIDDLVVHHDWRRQGIARLLYDACETWARERGAPWLETNVYDFNVGAYDFYQTLGFETTLRKMRKPLDK